MTYGTSEFEAQYPGVCDACEGPILVGQKIRNSVEAQRGHFSYEHVECPPTVVDKVPGEKPCHCGLIHRGDCF